MSFAGKIEIEVLRISGATEQTVLWDKTDPYIKLTLHDGQYDEGGAHRGESVKTQTKDNAGGTVSFNEKFILNKPENMDVARVELYDSNVTSDELLGSIDLDLDAVYKESKERTVDRVLELVKGGKSSGKVELKVKMSA